MRKTLNCLGKEFFFSGGICYENPKTTAFGNPLKEIPLGETEITAEEFMDFLQSVKSEFVASKYDIFDNNCNHFSNVCSEFLVGEEIPKEISGQANEFKNTPIGNLLQGFNVNPGQNNDNYNISYQGLQGNPQGKSKEIVFYLLI